MINVTYFVFFLKFLWSHCIIVAYFVVLSESLWSQSTNHVLGYVDGCGCHSNRVQW